MKKLRFTEEERVFLNELSELTGSDFHIKPNGRIRGYKSNRQALLVFIDNLKMRSISKNVLERVAKIVSKDSELTTDDSDNNNQ